MNVPNQFEIIAPKDSIYANEVSAFRNSELLDKLEIAHILRQKKMSIDCIIIGKKTSKKKQNILEPEVVAAVFIVNSKFMDYFSEFASFMLIKELKNKILLLDETNESRLILRRLMHAYKIGAPAEIIAKFAVHKEYNNDVSLQVTAADLTEFTIDSKQINSLSQLSYKELQDFEIEEYGFHISWPKKDIHLNLDSFSMICDAKFMRNRIKEIEKERINFGLLMKKFREDNGKLTQKDFGKLNERQIRKYENGENFPTYESLQAISSAYNMSVNDYLNALSEMKE